MKIKYLIKDFLALCYYNTYQRYRPLIGNRILMYHALGTQLPWGDYGISMPLEQFKGHMEFCAKYFHFVPISEIQSHLDDFTLSLSFDDGYKDNLLALEILETLQIPFTIYISTSFIGKNYWLNKEEIKQLANSTLCTIGTHGHTHTKLAQLPYQKQQYELEISKKILEDLLGMQIIHGSYPYSSYNKQTMQIAKDLGYHFISAGGIALNTISNYNPTKLHRFEIITSDNTTKLNKKILGYYDYLELKELFR